MAHFPIPSICDAFWRPVSSHHFPVVTLRPEYSEQVENRLKRNFDDHMAMAMKPVLLAVFLLCLLTNGVTPYPRKIRDFFLARAKRTCECHGVINQPCSSETICANLSVRFCHCYTEYYSCLPTYDPIENRYKNTCQNPVVKRSLSAMSNKDNNEMEQ